MNPEMGPIFVLQIHLHLLLMKVKSSAKKAQRLEVTLKTQPMTDGKNVKQV